MWSVQSQEPQHQSDLYLTYFPISSSCSWDHLPNKWLAPNSGLWVRFGGNSKTGSWQGKASLKRWHLRRDLGVEKALAMQGRGLVLRGGRVQGGGTRRPQRPQDSGPGGVRGTKGSPVWLQHRHGRGSGSLEILRVCVCVSVLCVRRYASHVGGGVRAPVGRGRLLLPFPPLRADTSPHTQEAVFRKPHFTYPFESRDKYLFRSGR